MTEKPRETQAESYVVELKEKVNNSSLMKHPFFGGIHAAIASSLSQIVTSPRLLRPRSYSLQFRILYFVLYWRLIRLDFPAAMTLPP